MFSLRYSKDPQSVLFFEGDYHAVTDDDIGKSNIDTGILQFPFTVVVAVHPDGNMEITRIEWNDHLPMNFNMVEDYIRESFFDTYKERSV